MNEFYLYVVEHGEYPIFLTKGGDWTFRLTRAHLFKDEKKAITIANHHDGQIRAIVCEIKE